MPDGSYYISDMQDYFEFGIKNFELLRQKDAYSYEYNFEKCKEEKLRNNECFYSSVKDGKTDGHGEKLDGHIGD